MNRFFSGFAHCVSLALSTNCRACPTNFRKNPAGVTPNFPRRNAEISSGLPRNIRRVTPKSPRRAPALRHLGFAVAHLRASAIRNSRLVFPPFASSRRSITRLYFTWYCSSEVESRFDPSLAVEKSKSPGMTKMRRIQRINCGARRLLRPNGSRCRRVAVIAPGRSRVRSPRHGIKN
jgi:hypothetical protein